MQAELPRQVEELSGFAVRHGLIAAGRETGVLVQDADGVITSADPTAERILGLTLAQLRGLVVGDLSWAYIDERGEPIPVDRMPAIEALATGEPAASRVLGVYRPSAAPIGEHLWLDVHSVPLSRPGQTRPHAVLSMFAVITGDRLRDLQLAHVQRLYARVLEHSADVVALLSPEGVTVWVSPAVSRAFGYDPRELVGVTAFDVVHPDDLESSVEALRAVVAGQVLGTRLRRLRHSDGHYLWVEFVSRLLTDDHDQPVQVLSAMRDVTARVNAERERDAAVQRFEMAMKHAPIGMVVASLEGVLLEVNDSFADFVGYPPAELVGRGMRDIMLVEDWDDADDAMRRLLDGVDSMTSERRYRRSDGTVVWGRRSVVLVRDPTGTPLYFLAQVQDVTERKAVQGQLAALAMTDPLTGLPNRLVLLDRLTHALAIARRDGNRVGVLFLDLDMFKHVNDTFGHEAGDEVLRQVGARLTATVRDEDTALRLGGDEFILVCEKVTDSAEVRRLAERVTRAIAEPYELGDEQTSVSVSIGIAIGDGPSAEALLARADASMYQAKKSGRNHVSIYEEAAHADAVDRLAIEAELWSAVESEQLLLHYQPVITLADGTVWGREALVRWQHPARGLLHPDTFLPAAEHSKLIVTIGTWVLQRACTDAARWGDSGTVAVNISARHLARAEFPATVRDALDRTGLDPTRLCLEITESSVLHASQSTLASTRALLDLGVSLSLDDFGTGQSSIAALHKLRLQAIKIDRSFVGDLVANPAAANLVEGLIHLGRGLGLDVIAEGIETVEQAEWLIAHGCPRGQGYLYGRPEALSNGHSPRVGADVRAG